MSADAAVQGLSKPDARFEQKQAYGISDNNHLEFEEVSFSTATSGTHKQYMHAAHCMFYSFETLKLWDRYPKVGNIMVSIKDRFCYSDMSSPCIRATSPC